MSKNKKKYSIKGRPPTYESVEEMMEVIDDYLSNTDIKEWTVTGLALHLGFNSRQTLINYEGKEDFMDTIKKAKLMIEHSYEIDLKERGNSGTIFALKNFDWKDKSEIDFTKKDIINENELED